VILSNYIILDFVRSEECIVCTMFFFPEKVFLVEEVVQSQNIIVLKSMKNRRKW